MENKPILSICIPTWNRAKILSLSLNEISKQMDGIDINELELFVSDNCSDDDTPDVVKKYQLKGLPITYNRNEKNLGAANNFIKCMQWASGKYILLLGDDDLFLPGAIKYVLDLIRSDEYGLINIHHYVNLEDDIKVYDNVEDYFKQISFWLTFMSGCIFRKEVVSMINADNYKNTHLLQMPYYIKSALLGKHNIIINRPLINDGLDSQNNGGYNFYEVFVRNYLEIWNEFVKENSISIRCFNFLRKDIYIRFIVNFSYRFFVLHQDIMEESKDYIGNRKGFKIKNAKQILFNYYGDHWYYRITFWYYLKIFYRRNKLKVKNGDYRVSL